mmetsp:Transcript_23178/g.48220  ORF Transcript_23178/g.48220 Transcript_23178/m.48220 type:complete len:196 (+) Transcript_23178:108-695(+)
MVSSTLTALLCFLLAVQMIRSTDIGMDANVTSGTCCIGFPPEKCTTQTFGGFPEMLTFASDPTILAYAYGKPFRNKGQIMVWSYEAEVRKVWMWFGKPECLTRTLSGPCRNIPTSGGLLGSCQACPSCVSTRTLGCSMEGGAAFDVGDVLELGSFAKGRLVRVGGFFKLENTERPGKYLQPIYACGSSCVAVKFA